MDLSDAHTIAYPTMAAHGDEGSLTPVLNQSMESAESYLPRYAEYEQYVYPDSSTYSPASSPMPIHAPPMPVCPSMPHAQSHMVSWPTPYMVSSSRPSPFGDYSSAIHSNQLQIAQLEHNLRQTQTTFMDWQQHKPIQTERHQVFNVCGNQPLMQLQSQMHIQPMSMPIPVLRPMSMSVPMPMPSPMSIQQFASPMQPPSWSPSFVVSHQSSPPRMPMPPLVARAYAWQ
jgi:hypothetical protein